MHIRMSELVLLKRKKNVQLCIDCLCACHGNDTIIDNLIFLQLFECTIPQPLGMLEAFVYEEEEYPVVCFGVKET